MRGYARRPTPSTALRCALTLRLQHCERSVSSLRHNLGRLSINAVHQSIATTQFSLLACKQLSFELINSICRARELRSAHPTSCQIPCDPSCSCATPPPSKYHEWHSDYHHLQLMAMQYSHEATPSPHCNWVPSRHQCELVLIKDHSSIVCASLCPARVRFAPACRAIGLTRHLPRAVSALTRVLISLARWLAQCSAAQCQAAKNPAHDSPALHTHTQTYTVVHSSCSQPLTADKRAHFAHVTIALWQTWCCRQREQHLSTKW
jgi:hypothetical protein